MTLNVSRLNYSTQRQRVAEWIPKKKKKKNNPYICCLQDISDLEK